MVFCLAAADRTFVVPVTIMVSELPVPFRRESCDQRTNDFANHVITTTCKEEPLSKGRKSLLNFRTVLHRFRLEFLPPTPGSYL